MRAGLGVESQIGLACTGVGAVASVAPVRQDRSDLAIEPWSLLGARQGARGQNDADGGNRGGQDNAILPHIVRRRKLTTFCALARGGPGRKIGETPGKMAG